MFSGITQFMMPIAKITENMGNLLFSIQKPTEWDLGIGESIMVDGICSTVIETGGNFVVEYMPETIMKTNISAKKVGEMVNLERSLRLNDLLGGHLVSGHIDTTGRVQDIKVEENSKVIKISFKGGFGKYLVNKGSVAINGVSLTVVTAEKNSFTVSLIPHTLEVTNFGNLKENDTVNLEFDLIAKYLEGLNK